MPTDAAVAVRWCSEGVDRLTAQKKRRTAGKLGILRIQDESTFSLCKGAADKSVICEGVPDTCCINGDIVTWSEKNA